MPKTNQSDATDRQRMDVDIVCVGPATAGFLTTLSRQLVNADGTPAVALRARFDMCLTGCRLAKDRAAEALTKGMTREALDYPA
jgi:hypothetical protein